MENCGEVKLQCPRVVRYTLLRATRPVFVILSSTDLDLEIDPSYLLKDSRLRNTATKS